MRTWIFRLIAISIPFIFFGLLELGLRIAGYGISYPLFIENPANNHYLLPQPDIIKRYFSKDAPLPSVTMEANFLLKNKPDNGYRVIVQGGSTAAGFPYGLGASLAGMLDQRLKASLPNRYVEVVNTAMSAVNSYTVLDFADEIIAQQPDAIAIYMGHNEYLGILGVGSNYTAANSAATTLLFLKLKELRVFQLLQNAYQATRGEQNEHDKNDFSSSRTLMSKVAKHKNIPLDSALYQAGLEQFENNLSLLLDKYRAANIPVYIATVASNLKDHAPFSSDAITETQKTELADISASLEAKNNDTATKLIKALAKDSKASTNAALMYQLAQYHLAMGNRETAAQSFTRAKDLDLLRFRAPEAINEIIRAQVKLYPQVYLVDVEQRLRTASPDKIIGNNFMLEHLHPNVQAYFLLADSFYQVLNNYAGLNDWQSIDIKQAWQERPLIPSEEYLGFAKVLQLKGDYPFTDSPITLPLPKPADWQQVLGKQHYQKQIDWLTMMQRAFNRYRTQKDSHMTHKTAQLLADALPHEAKINVFVADSFMAQQKPGQASMYYYRAYLVEAGNETVKKQLIKAYRRSGQTGKAALLASE